MNEAEKVLSEMAMVVFSNTQSLSRLGARSVVLEKFVEAVLPQLTWLQRSEVTHKFREGVEDVLSFMDDVTLPGEYHSALLQLVNELLGKLERGCDVQG
ncbi:MULTISPECIES: hypothetical protein [Burkholderiaceae]|uniref:Uncharacterized protein n=1 Tax=Caballeronia zhejiangensis TaxID=871203 RepID=A0A656QG57_9BURK|nr:MULTISPECIES: hypothetical protein [Burkholderiaceae]KAK42497.1 hypothetical protein BG58_41555 [Caballeronia jiangsuensis]KDR26078.1 hypothetical protein BG60_24110 [Caballeronia zhejiangensis]KWU24267.1 hypothetical protein AS149_34275 [Burkholderia cenocepacia]SAL77567.1 hypothetical protein AWB71_05490 [Caballeronia peredens]